MYSDKGGLHTLFTKPTFFTFVSFVTLVGLSALVCLGFKTEWSSLLLAVILFLSNLYMCASFKRGECAHGGGLWEGGERGGGRLGPLACKDPRRV
jgi:uncharacterized membrane protein YphA (DoxX/SURF4 family)